MQLAENTGRKKSPSGHHRMTLSGYIFTTKACIDNQKKNLLISNISSTCPHNMANFGPLTAHIGLSVCGTPPNFNRFHVLALLLQWHRSSDANQTLHDLWLSIYTLSRALAAWWNFARCKTHFAPQVLCSTILAALLHGILAAGVSQTLQHGRRNGITEIWQTASPIFSWVAIMMGIRPHSSNIYILLARLQTWRALILSWVCLSVCVSLTGTSTLQRWPILMKLGRKDSTVI